MACATAGWLRHFNPPPLRPSKPGYRNRYPFQAMLGTAFAEVKLSVADAFGIREVATVQGRGMHRSASRCFSGVDADANSDRRFGDIASDFMLGQNRLDSLGLPMDNCHRPGRSALAPDVVQALSR